MFWNNLLCLRLKNNIWLPRDCKFRFARSPISSYLKTLFLGDKMHLSSKIGNYSIDVFIGKITALFLCFFYGTFKLYIKIFIKLVCFFKRSPVCVGKGLNIHF